MSRLDADQIRQVKEIGAQLSQKRLELSMPLEEIAAKTYVQLRHLKAIESGQVDQLPEPVFVQGFIRRYADAVGLDGVAMAKPFIATPSYREFHESGEESNSSASKPFSLKAPKINKFKLNWGYVGIGLVATLVAGGTYMIVSQPAILGSLLPRKDNPGVTPSSSPASAIKPTPKVANSPAPATSVQIQVSLTDASSLQVKVDGKVEFDGILAAGSKESWKAQRELILEAGNAGGVMVSFNGREPKALGEIGEVKRVIFSPGNPEPKVESPDASPDSGQPR